MLFQIITMGVLFPVLAPASAGNCFTLICIRDFSLDLYHRSKHFCSSIKICSPIPSAISLFMQFSLLIILQMYIESLICILFEADRHIFGNVFYNGL